ncbi:hypothetical protein VM1G_11963 [Cytospora mali]|uniref:Uncharacterized protein n=1 Tax=Cytospora mali TaxID=578113 RepID=A0A194WCP3_CYTMA|nr:hypothetical protein VM1G_11963 [Valsa mali]
MPLQLDVVSPQAADTSLRLLPQTIIMLAQPIPMPVIRKPYPLIITLHCRRLRRAYHLRLPILHDMNLHPIHVRNSQQLDLPTPLSRIPHLPDITLEVLLQEPSILVPVLADIPSRLPPHGLVPGLPVLPAQRYRPLLQLVRHRREQAVPVRPYLLLHQPVLLELVLHVLLLRPAVVRHVGCFLFRRYGSGLLLRGASGEPPHLFRKDSVHLLSPLCLVVVLYCRLVVVVVVFLAIAVEPPQLLGMSVLHDPLHLGALVVDALARLLGRVLLLVGHAPLQVLGFLAVPGLHLLEGF